MQRNRENERAEEAWLVWSGEGDQNNGKTAQITGIPLRTIQYYAASRNWEGRYAGMLGPQGEGSALLTRNRMRMRLPQIEEELFQIITGQEQARSVLEGTPLFNRDGSPIMTYSEQARDRVMR